MLLGLLLGLGLFLVWWSCWVPAPPTRSSRRRSGPLDRLSDEIVQAGFAGLSVRTLLAGTVVAFFLVLALVHAIVGVLAIAVTLLRYMGSDVTHCGAIGCGQVVKLYQQHAGL